MKYWINTLRFQRAQNTNIWYDTRWYLLYLRVWYNNWCKFSEEDDCTQCQIWSYMYLFTFLCCVVLCFVFLFCLFVLGFFVFVLCLVYPIWLVCLDCPFLQFIHNVVNPPILYLPWRWMDYISYSLVNITFWPHRISINSTNVSCQLDLNSYTCICISFYVQFLVIFVRK